MVPNIKVFQKFPYNLTRMSPVTSHPYLSEDQQRELHDIAKALSRPGAGILAADETPKAMEARFASLKIENTPEVNFQIPKREDK